MQFLPQDMVVISAVQMFREGDILCMFIWKKKDGKRSLGFVLGEWMYNPTTRVPLAARIFIYFILWEMVYLII